jgi:hypothetical protein
LSERKKNMHTPDKVGPGVEKPETMIFIAEFILHPAINYSDPIVRGNLKFAWYKFASEQRNKQQSVVNFGL